MDALGVSLMAFLVGFVLGFYWDRLKDEAMPDSAAVLNAVLGSGVLK